MAGIKAAEDCTNVIPRLEPSVAGLTMRFSPYAFVKLLIKEAFKSCETSMTSPGITFKSNACQIHFDRTLSMPMADAIMLEPVNFNIPRTSTVVVKL